MAYSPNQGPENLTLTDTGLHAIISQTVSDVLQQLSSEQGVLRVGVHALTENVTRMIQHPEIHSSDIIDYIQIHYPQGVDIKPKTDEA